MSRSYKHTPVYKGDKRKSAKHMANKHIRHIAKNKPYDSYSGKSNNYRKEYESWDICDYRMWGGRNESLRNIKGALWDKCYKGK